MAKGEITDFEYWMRRVNRYILGEIGMTADDLPDAAWRSMFDTGEEPEQAARDVLEDEGYPVSQNELKADYLRGKVKVYV